MNEIVSYATIQDIITARGDYLARCQRWIAQREEDTAVLGVVGIRHFTPTSRYGSFDLPSFAGFQTACDTACWRRVIALAGLASIMPSRDYDDLLRQIEDKPPEFTWENVKSTITTWLAGQETTLDKACWEIFGRLGTRKAHDPYMVGAQVVIPFAVEKRFDGTFRLYRSSRGKNQVVEFDRIFRVLDGKPPREPGNGIEEILHAVIRDPGVNVAETDYFRFRWFANENGHVWFTRADLVEALNKRLARHAGNVLADAR